MKLVQVLPGVPTFAQQLLPQINESLSQIVGGYNQGVTKRNDESTLERISQFDSNVTPQQQLAEFAKLSAEKRKDLAPLYSQIFKQQSDSVESNSKRQQQNLEKQKAVNRVSRDLDRLEELKEYTGSQKFGTSIKTFEPSIIGPKINRHALEKRAEIDALGTQIADYAYNVLLENKGALSEAKIRELIKPYLISSKDSERVYQGKLNSLRSKLEKIESGSSVEQTFSEKTSDQESYRKEAQSILDQANGDVEKARAIARKKGFKY